VGALFMGARARHGHFLTDTDILNFSYDGHGHVAIKCVRKRTRKRTLPTFHITDTDILHYACQNTDTERTCRTSRVFVRTRTCISISCP
jgi:hypothetical protein